MSASLPNPEDVSVDDIQQFIENMPEEKRQELLSRVGAGGAGDVGDKMGM